MKKIFYVLLSPLWLVSQTLIPQNNNFLWSLSNVNDKYEFIDFAKYPYYVLYKRYPTSLILFNSVTKKFIPKDTSEAIRDFKILGENFVAIKKENLFAISNSSGKLISDYVFSAVEEFNDSLCLVVKDNKKFLLNSEGELLSYYNFLLRDIKNVSVDDTKQKIYFSRKTVYKSVKDIIVFSGNLLLLKQKNGKLLINGKGDKLFFISEFRRNPYGVFIKRNNKWGFISLQGKLLTPFAYDTVSDYNYGYAVVGISVAMNRFKFGLIDSLGNLKITPQYSAVKILSRDFSVVKERKKASVFYNSGKKLSDFVFDDAFGFYDMLVLKIRKPFTPGQINFIKKHNLNDDYNFLYIITNINLEIFRVFYEKKVEKFQDTLLRVYDGLETVLLDENLRTISKKKGEIIYYKPKAVIIRGKNSLFLLTNSGKHNIDFIKKRKYYTLAGNEKESFYLDNKRYIKNSFVIDSVIFWGNNIIGIQENKGIYLFDVISKTLSTEDFEEVFNVNENLLVIKKQNKFYLYDPMTEQKNFITSRLTNLKVLNDELIAYYYGKQFYLYDVISKSSIKFRFGISDIRKYSDGFCAFKTAKGWNFFDEKFNILSKEYFDQVSDFSGGFAYVKKGLYWGVIDNNGLIILPFKFIYADLEDPKTNGIFHLLIEKRYLKINNKPAKNEMGYRWIFINSKNEEPIRTLLPPASYYTHFGYAVIKGGFTDEKGNIYSAKWGWEHEKELVITPKYDSIGIVKGNLLKIKKKNLYGLYFLDNKEFILPISYKYISDIYNGKILLIDKKDKTYIKSIATNFEISVPEVLGITGNYFIYQEQNYIAVHDYNSLLFKIPNTKVQIINDKYVGFYSNISFRKYYLIK